MSIVDLLNATFAFLLCLLRACDVPSYPSPLCSWTSAMYLLNAGDRLLLPQRCGRASPSYEGGDRWHSGGHHRSKCLWVSALHVRSTAFTQVGMLWEIPHCPPSISNSNTQAKTHTAWLLLNHINLKKQQDIEGCSHLAVSLKVVFTH